LLTEWAAQDMRRADWRQGDRPATDCFDTLPEGVVFAGEVACHEFDQSPHVPWVVGNDLGGQFPVEALRACAS